MAQICKVIKYKNSPDRTIEWYQFSIAYLQAILFLVIHLKEQGEEEEDQIRSYKLLIPLLFNMRHFIELMLKFMSYSTSIPQKLTHDLSELFKHFQSQIENTDKSKISKMSTYLNLPVEDVYATLIKRTNQLGVIANKYCRYSFLLDDNISIDDPKNELFRYPVSFNTDFKLDLENIHKKITLDEILADLDFLNTEALIFCHFFGFTEKGIPFYEAFEVIINSSKNTP